MSYRRKIFFVILGRERERTRAKSDERRIWVCSCGVVVAPRPTIGALRSHVFGSEDSINDLAEAQIDCACIFNKSSRFPAFPRTPLDHPSRPKVGVAPSSDGHRPSSSSCESFSGNPRTHPRTSPAHTQSSRDTTKEKWQMSLYHKKIQTEDEEKLRDSENWRKKIITQYQNEKATKIWEMWEEEYLLRQLAT